MLKKMFLEAEQFYIQVQTGLFSCTQRDQSIHQENDLDSIILHWIH